MRTYFRLPALALASLLLCSASSIAQNPAPRFHDPADSAKIMGVVTRYLAFMPNDTIPNAMVDLLTAGEMQKRLIASHGLPVRFPAPFIYTLSAPRSVRDNDSLAIVTAAVSSGIVPLFGPLTVDWVFFLQPVDNAWRLTAIRRLAGIEDAVAQMNQLDSSNYPLKLKKIIAAETGRTLLSNDQIRQHFRDHSVDFQRLAENFRRPGHDSIWMMGRTDRVITQVNNFGISWGDAAQNIPHDVAEEFLAKLPREQQAGLRAQLRQAEETRKEGYDSLARIAKRIGITTKRLDSMVMMMHDLGISFANTRLPWKGAVQFTLGGHFDDVVGLIYSPGGGVPLVSPREYFYVEQIAEGWWMFRST
ncbi:MAG: hypothetical protein JWQ98_606 [Chlorobi bacterium]|nr:hypothetical protein [Chlorobiota bacterium]